MDANQIPPTPEQQPVIAGADAERLLADNLEAKVAAANETANGQVKADDGVAGAQAQLASVTGDDATAAQPVGQADPQGVAAPLPAVAADVDVIEPEWVKKIEETVAKHRDDPRAEEAAVADIQIDYLKKRYNLDVKPGDEKP